MFKVKYRSCQQEIFFRLWVCLVELCTGNLKHGNSFYRLFIRRILFYTGIILFCVITFGGSSDPDARCPAYRIFTKFEEECQYNMFQATTIAHLQLEESGTVNGSDVIQLISRDCE